MSPVSRICTKLKVLFACVLVVRNANCLGCALSSFFFTISEEAAVATASSSSSTAGRVGVLVCRRRATFFTLRSREMLLPLCSLVLVCCWHRIRLSAQLLPARKNDDDDEDDDDKACRCFVFRNSAAELELKAMQERDANGKLRKRARGTEKCRCSSNGLWKDAAAVMSERAERAFEDEKEEKTRRVSGGRVSRVSTLSLSLSSKP